MGWKGVRGLGRGGVVLNSIGMNTISMIDMALVLKPSHSYTGTSMINFLFVFPDWKQNSW